MTTKKKNLWFEALKEYNKNTHEDAWCVVKKGSKEYDKVQNIKEQLKFYGGEMPNVQYKKNYKVEPNRLTLSQRYNNLKPNDFIASTNDKGRTIFKCPVCDTSWVKRPTQEQIDKHEKVSTHIKGMERYRGDAYYKQRDADLFKPPNQQYKNKIGPQQQKPKKEPNQQYKNKIGPQQQKKKPKDDGLKLISISREDFAKMKF